MDPVERWRTKGMLPWKLILQIMKVLVVTVQVIMLGNASAAFQKQHRNTRIALEHILLKKWDTARDVLIYPPPQGPYAVYTVNDFFDHIDHVVKRYSNITTDPIRTFGYGSRSGGIVPIAFCVTRFQDGVVWPFNSTLFLDGSEVNECTRLNTTWPAGSDLWRTFSIKKFLEATGTEIVFEQLITADLQFPLTTLYNRKFADGDKPECYKYDVSVQYRNFRHSGQISISLKTTPTLQPCHKDVKHYPALVGSYYPRQVLNAVTISMCLLSTILCSRSLYRAQKLRVTTAQFFRVKYGKNLTWSDSMLFLDLWFVMIIVDDCLIEAGSALKIQIEERMIPGLRYNMCSVFLGSGTLFAWCGLLRYVGYFKTYNILILTLKKAVPNIIRFLICCLLLFSGYVICGWIVIGPHHIKFQTASRTAECLFSIANGDDIFATFAMLFKKNNTAVWYFAIAYIYTYIILFVYLVVSLFVAIIVDAYEIIKDGEAKLPTLSPIQAFLADGSDERDDSIPPSQHDDLKGTASCG